MSTATLAKPLRTNHMMKRLISYALLAAVFFLLGFLPLWASTLGSASNLAATGRQLSVAQLQNSLGSAVIDVQRGDYAPALASISSFYTALRAEADRGSASAFSAAQITSLQPLFAQRDEIITLLARSDPAAGARLSDLYTTFRQIIA